MGGQTDIAHVAFEIALDMVCLNVVLNVMLFLGFIAAQFARELIGSVKFNICLYHLSYLSKV